MAQITMAVTNPYEPDPRVQKEAASLVAAGHRVRVYAFDRLHAAKTTRETLEGVEIVRLQLGRYPYGKPVPTAIGLSRFLRAVKQELLRDKPDVMHCHDQDTCPLGVFWQKQRSAAGRPGRFVFDAHDLYWTFILAGGDAAWRHAISGVQRVAAMRYVYKADLLITVTEGKQHPGYAEIYRGWGVDPLVIWNASRAVTAIPPLPERFTLGYYGYVRDTSMFEWLVAAIETLPAEQRPALRVAGAGVAQERVRELLMQASARLNIPVQVTGAFEMRELGALMAQCSAQFCVYSLRDGNMSRTMPVKLFDAVAHGRPVIGNEGTLMGDYIRDRNWGWTVTEGDVAGLARAIASANERLHGLSVPPPLAAAPTWEEQGDKLCAAYERLLAGA